MAALPEPLEHLAESGLPDHELAAGLHLGHDWPVETGERAVVGEQDLLSQVKWQVALLPLVRVELALDPLPTLPLHHLELGHCLELLDSLDAPLAHVRIILIVSHIN